MGVASTFARFQIAKELWENGVLDTPWLNRFSFMYLKVNECPNTEFARNLVSKAEDLAIQKLQPRANTITKRNFTGVFDEEKVERVFKDYLTNYQLNEEVEVNLATTHKNQSCDGSSYLGNEDNNMDKNLVEDISNE